MRTGRRIRKAIGLAIAGLLFSTPAIADEWSKLDISREVVWQTVHYMDWMQTRQIARHPEEYHEENPILGKHPSVSEVNQYMVASAIGHVIVANYIPDVIRGIGLPESWASSSRMVFQYVTIGMSGGCVANNFNIGLRVSF